MYDVFMELTLEGHTMFHAEGTVTIELPEYMKPLEPGERAEALKAENRPQLIVAAGRHPNSGDLVFITGVGELMEVRFNEFIPDERLVTESMFPIDHGQTIKIVLRDFEDVEVSAEWALRVGRQLINLGTLADKRGARVAYIDDEVDATPVEESD